MSYYDELGKYEPDVLPILDGDLPILCTLCRAIIDEPDQNSWWLGQRQEYGPFCTIACAEEIQWEAYVNDDEKLAERSGPYHVSEYDPATGDCLSPLRCDVLDEREEEEAPTPDDTVFFCVNCEDRIVYSPNGICERYTREGVFHCMGCATGLCGESEMYCRECANKRS